MLIGAHLDSWHGGTGGADNGSGCITMIEAMRILKALDIKPRRTIRLALWGGEEQGLYGSRGYADHKLYDKEQKKKLPEYDDFALYLNMDFGSVDSKAYIWKKMTWHIHILKHGNSPWFH